MAKVNRKLGLENFRQQIAAKVRELRTARGWTQAELAEHLQLSQNRLSEIERGDGSFTAEQFLVLLQLFNVAASDFVTERREHGLELQNALARHGATYLHESVRILPSAELEQAHDVVREALIDGSPRIVAALAPVLVRNADRLNFAKLHAELERIGRDRRLAWAIDNTLVALERLAHSSLSASREWAKVLRRVELSFKLILELAEMERDLDGRERPWDVLDHIVRSKRTLEDAIRVASEPSKRWGIVTALQPDDFMEALRASNATH